MLPRALDSLAPLVRFDEDGRPDFPTFVGCWVCSGIKAYFRDGVNYPDKDTAHTLALVQHGYYVAKWEGMNVANTKLFPTKCICTCAHANTKERTVGRCLHQWTCLDCGAGTTVDSSD